MEANPHHLIMGELTDFLTGKIIPDTHDERYLQKLSKHLVACLGYDKEDIIKDQELNISAGGRKAMLKVNFMVKFQDKVWMIVKFAPGSLVTRRLSNLALSRVITPYQIPFIVTTNGEDAEIINGITGKVSAQGLDHIPGKEKLLNMDAASFFQPVKPGVYEKASMIAFACEIDGACPCDTDRCVV